MQRLPTHCWKFVGIKVMELWESICPEGVKWRAGGGKIRDGDTQMLGI